MGGLLWLAAGGFLGYSFAKERYTDRRVPVDANSNSGCGTGWGSWSEHRRARMAAHQAYLESLSQGNQTQQQQTQSATLPGYDTSIPAQARAEVPSTIDPAEYGLFQQWKAAKDSRRGFFNGWGQPSATQGTQDPVAVETPATPFLQAPLVSDQVKAQAAANADKALDVLMSQVASLKERLAEYRGNSQSLPGSGMSSPILAEKKLV